MQIKELAQRGSLRGVRDPLRIWTAVASTVAAGAAWWAACSVVRAPARTCDEPTASEPAVAAAEPSTPAEAPPAPATDPDAFPEQPALGQSEGLPADGHLHRGTRLPSGEDRLIRNPDAAFGTQDMVRHLDAALATLRREHPRVHRVLVGDLSHEVGGRLSGHVSHQSGSDVDVGFLYRERSAPSVRTFEDATKDNLNLRATFTLLQALAASSGEPGGMQWGLLDYEVQRILVQWARRNRAASKDELDRLFQYPKGAYAPAGLYRHYPNHRNHVHVRYACPPDDAMCRSPIGPPVRKAKVPPDDRAPVH